MTVIASINPMFGRFPPSNTVPVIITSGVPSNYELTGSALDQIESVNWYPANPGTVKFRVRNLVLVDHTRGTFIIEVIDNYLDTSDRKGRIGFTLVNGSSISYPVQTIGPVSAMPLWIAPAQGLITG